MRVAIRIKEILWRVDVFCGFHVFSSIRFWNQFWDLWDFLLVANLAPRPFETGLLGALGPAKSRSRLVFFGPERLQERSKMEKGGFQKGDQKRTKKRDPRYIGFSGMRGPPGRTIGGV